ncbi:MAG: peptide chain release factor 1 [Planctomycetes bacterium]|nr:peptide chain release factor 1 [Planctomycetota bacterium]
MAEKTDIILSKLDELDARYSQIEKQIADPEIACNSDKLIALSKEMGKLKITVTKYRQYKEAVSQIEDAKQMLEDEATEEELKTMATEEIQLLQKTNNTLLDEIASSLVMAEDSDINSIIMEIRAGTGGDEAALFARDLYNMYTHYAEDKKWKIEQLDFSTTEKGGFREVIFSVKGKCVWSQLHYEAGGHRVQRVPETESQGRVHTSAATVAVLAEPEEIDIKIAPNDVLEHVSRAGGPGGQSVNKINSAIKLEHIPTGITVSMRDEKSQHKNRAKAWRILRSRLYEHYQSKEQAERDSQRKNMIGSGDRSAKIRTYNWPQNRITDHRINLSLYSLDKIITGNMGELIEALKNYDKEQRLKNL